MFGIFYMAATAIYKLCGNIAISRENEERRKNSKSEFGTYIDYHGAERDIRTNEYRITSFSKNGVKQYDKYGRVVRDISAERKVATDNAKVRNGATAIHVGSSSIKFAKECGAPYASEVFKMIDTGDIVFQYKVFNNGMISVYYNPKTKEIIDISDKCKIYTVMGETDDEAMKHVKIKVKLLDEARVRNAKGMQLSIFSPENKNSNRILIEDYKYVAVFDKIRAEILNTEV